MQIKYMVQGLSIILWELCLLVPNTHLCPVDWLPWQYRAVGLIGRRGVVHTCSTVALAGASCRFRNIRCTTAV